MGRSFFWFVFLMSFFGVFGFSEFYRFSVFGEVAFADPIACHCDRYKQFAPVLDLASQVGALGMRALDDQGRAFASQKTQAEYYRLQLESQNQIPAECRERVIDMKLPRLTLSATFNSSARNHATYYSGINDGESLFSSLFYRYYDSVVPRSDRTLAVGKYLPGFREQIKNLSDDEFEKHAMKTAYNLPGSRVPQRDEFSVLRGYVLLTSTKDKAEFDSLLAGYKKNMTNQQKISLIRMLGAFWLSQYDDARANKTIYAIGEKISPEQILETSYENSANGSRVLGFGAGARKYKGVCRDMAVIQATAAEKLGLKNPYIVSYAVRGGYHTNVVFQNPDHPEKVYRLNYEDMREYTSADSRTLSGGSDDVALVYRISTHEGKPAVNVPSEVGKFLSSAAGFDARNLDQLVTVHASNFGANYALDQQRKTNIAAGYGVDGNGDQYLYSSIGRDYNVDPKSYFPGRVGLVLANQSKENLWLESKTQKAEQNLNLQLVYAQLEQKFKTPTLQLSPEIQARIDTTMNLILMAGRTTNVPGTKSGFVGDGDLHLTPALVVEKNKGQVQGRAQAGVDLVPALSDVSAMTGTVLLNRAFFDAEARAKMCQTQRGCAYLIAATTVLVDALGVRGRADLGLSQKNVGGFLRVEGRLNNDSPVYQDSSQRRVGLGLSWHPINHIKINLQGSVALENNVDPRVNANVGGQF